VSGTPVFHAGHIFAAHATGLINGAGQFVAGIEWWDYAVTTANGYPTRITSVAAAQDGLLNASTGFLSLTYPVLMVDSENDVILGYDYMGDTVFPSINVTSRRVTSAPSTLSGLGFIAVGGTASTTNTRWGDFEAMSYPATYQDFVWFASQYSNATGDWSTKVMRLKLALKG
jgi:hypothetical protein